MNRLEHVQERGGCEASAGVFLERFEDAWYRGLAPRIDDYLGAAGNPGLLVELVHRDLEFRLKRGEPVRIEAYLARYPSLQQDPQVLLELLRAEYLLRQRRETDVAVSEYTRRFPQLAAELSGELPHSTTCHVSDVVPFDQPGQIGRYRIEKILGQGGFGIVYLAHDDQLQRLVAIKVPHARLVAKAADAEAYLIEARMVANFDHPNIVPVHDVGGTAEFPCYVVSKYIDGTDLAKKLKQSRLPRKEAVELVITVADALHHAHRKGLVHRDVKPGNILLDCSGKPFVGDFGLALREQDFGTGPRYAGTPAYMSPEQARGEGHRVDGRSDIFSLGVVLYELLVGRRPFRGDSQQDLLDQITSVEARPPRQILDDIPKELDRICLKALSKKASERYSTALDMAEDLRHVLKSESAEAKSLTGGEAKKEGASPAPSSTRVQAISDAQPVKVVPKGLRSFDATDADFFLELLPGPRDRDGLPDSIRFWKIRVETTEADNTFAVGLIYGPSGCGKSSLVKAGLLPRLAKSVTTVYVEATGEETEVRLLKGLRRKLPDLPANLGLIESLTALRRGRFVDPGHKVLLVLDQFEQWLHARRNEENAELVQALRHCDGGRLQSIVLVRDDFWLAVSRFMKAMEVEILEGRNSALVDLFDPIHARKVLAAFGCAYGRLSDNPGQRSRDQDAFLDQAVAGFAREGKVITVRLALFAEMVKGKNWTPATLREVGGTEGIGVTFLEETFTASTAPPQHRLHQKAAQAVLKDLLPEAGTDIKGYMRSQAKLLDASGYAGRPRDFEELIRILDSEIRLITPTDPEGKDDPDQHVVQSGEKYYQLTHDYLVPSLRDWLTKKQKETRRGRAELLLADRAAVWNLRPENRQLPSLPQWCSIQWLTDKKNWTPPQRKMMRQAGRVVGIRSGIAAVLLASVIAAGSFIKGQIHDRQTEQARTLVQSLMAADTPDIEKLIDEVGKHEQLTTPLLREIVRLDTSNPKEKLHASLALVARDPAQVNYLYEQLLQADVAAFPVILGKLVASHEGLKARLWVTVKTAKSSAAEQQRRLRAAAALAAFDSKNRDWEECRVDVVTALVSAPLGEAKLWSERLQPVGDVLVEPLEDRYRDRAWGGDAERAIAATALAAYLKDSSINIGKLVNLIVLAETAHEFLPLLESLSLQQEAAVSALRRTFGGNGEYDDLPPKQASPDHFWRQQSTAAITLFRLGADEAFWPQLRLAKNPSLRSFIIDRLARFDVDPNALKRLAGHLADERDEAVRQAIILAMGKINVTKLAHHDRAPVVEQLQDLYRTDPDSGVHSAIAWTLRNWRDEKPIRDLDAQLLARPASLQQKWRVNSQALTLAAIRGPVTFTMGESSNAKEVHLHHNFAIATHEVTVEQFQQFRPEFRVPSEARTPDSPCTNITWCEAVAYCNWLSKKEGLPADQWCYVPNDNGSSADGMKTTANILERTGYRLPTNAEWEYACRAATTSTYCFGEPVELVSEYAWWSDNSQNRLWPVGQLIPNGLGLFDVHGNAAEWCHELDFQSGGDLGLRGGSFKDRSLHLGCAKRQNPGPSPINSNYGFRVARTCP